MSIYAYCLLRLPANENWPVMQGIGNHPVFPLRCGKYTMLLSRLDRNFRLTPRSIMEHGQVIARAFERQTVLPLRFATFFKNEQQIAQMVRKNQQELLEAFFRLRGKAEMRFRLLLTSPEAELAGAVRKGPRRSRSSRTAARVEEHVDPVRQEMARVLAARISELFQPLEQQTSCRQAESGELKVDCCHLIECERVENYRKLCQSAAEEMKEYDLRMSGPWPPYHFLPNAVRMPAPAPQIVRARAAVAAAR